MIEYAAFTGVNVEAIWDIVSPMINKAVKYADGEATLDGIYKRIKTGEYILIVVHENQQIFSALTLHIHEYEGNKFLYIGFAGGERLNEWHKPLLKIVEEIGREQGCKRLRIQGRRGWVKQMQSDGFKEIATTISKEL